MVLQFLNRSDFHHHPRLVCRQKYRRSNNTFLKTLRNIMDELSAIEIQNLNIDAGTLILVTVL